MRPLQRLVFLEQYKFILSEPEVSMLHVHTVFLSPLVLHAWNTRKKNSNSKKEALQGVIL